MDDFRPPPLLQVKVTIARENDLHELHALVLNAMAAQQDLGCTLDAHEKAMVIGAQSELQLEHVIRQLRESGLQVRIGTPQVAHRETIRRPTRVDYSHKKQTGKTGQFARVILEVMPNERGKGNTFESRIVESAIPKEYVLAVERGTRSAQAAGPLLGCPIVDVDVALIDIALHEMDSSISTFEIASLSAMREALGRAGSLLLEPMMKIEMTLPERYVESVIEDLHSRRGAIVDSSIASNESTLTALVPLAEALDYPNRLRSLTGNTATYSTAFSHFEPVEGEGVGPDDAPPVANRMRA